MCLFSPLDSEKMNSTFTLLDLRIYVSDLAVLILTNLAVLASWGGSRGGGNWEPCMFFGKHRKENGEPLPWTPPPIVWSMNHPLCKFIIIEKGPPCLKSLGIPQNVIEWARGVEISATKCMSCFDFMHVLSAGDPGSLGICSLYVVYWYDLTISSNHYS